ncbi:hypothetical protein, variant [Verruconis gallopava]|uniref:Zn(2)-C6 fungal-type domain-containing protein n=1 Tax=Verruconis gallopava TaxID=253628 RepID=A0A0D1XMB9_9PEZI|nr:hypothetical protein, variant [Verruconis gallopava]KIW03616.1 hypothetical protein, variant [Verruconis gallopava]
MDRGRHNGALPRSTPPNRHQHAPVPLRLQAGESSGHRLKTACSNCRQQKIKCRTNDDLVTPCERCARMSLTCAYEPRHVRGRRQRDKEALARAPKRMLVAKLTGDDNLRTSIAARSALSALPAPSPLAAGDSIHSRSSRSQKSSGITFTDTPIAHPSVAIIRSDQEPRLTSSGTDVMPPPPHPPHLHPQYTYQSSAQTLARSVDGLQLDADVIDNLFSKYFRCYHPFLPLIDSSLRPNDIYAQSSFLFWSILAVASRRWPKDPGLMPALRSRALTHAMTSIFSPTTGTSTITAILLLLSWSFPETQTYDEMPYVFSSALLHAAMRIGMNNPEATQDYSRIKLSLSEAECKRRFQLYAHCLVLYQRSSCCMGNSFGQIMTPFSQNSQQYMAALPLPLRFQMDVSDILVRASMAVAKNGLVISSQVQCSSFDSLLQNYLAELALCESRQSAKLSALELLYLKISELMLHAFQFFKTPADKHLESWRPAFDSACALVHQFNDLVKSMQIDLYGTFYVYHGVLLAACVILRCLKTPFAESIGDYYSTAQALLFSSINIQRNISVVEGDKPAKSSWGLQNLWRSNSAFRHSDGSWNLDLRVRSRFSSSVLYDTMWWVREEFTGQSGAYAKKSVPPPRTSFLRKGPSHSSISCRLNRICSLNASV